jgi:hypothetical protein
VTTSVTRPRVWSLLVIGLSVWVIWSLMRPGAIDA